MIKPELKMYDAAASSICPEARKPARSRIRAISDVTIAEMPMKNTIDLDTGFFESKVCI